MVISQSNLSASSSWVMPSLRLFFSTDDVNRFLLLASSAVSRTLLLFKCFNLVAVVNGDEGFDGLFNFFLRAV